MIGYIRKVHLVVIVLIVVVVFAVPSIALGRRRCKRVGTDSASASALSCVGRRRKSKGIWCTRCRVCTIRVVVPVGVVTCMVAAADTDVVAVSLHHRVPARYSRS